MKIAIDARGAGGDIRGIGYTVKKIIEQLAHIDTHNDYILLVNRRHTLLGKFPDNFIFRHVPGPIGFSDLVILPYIIKSINPDVVWFTANNCTLFIKHSVKVMSTIYDIMFFTQKNRFLTRQWLGGIYRRFFSKIAFRRARLIHTISMYNIGLISALSGRERGDIFCAYPGINVAESIDTSILEQLGLHGKDFLYTISGTSPNKNLTNTIRAFHLFQKMPGYNHYLLVITGVPLRDRFIRELDNSENIIFTGYINDQQKSALLKRCRMFLFLSRDEGFGIPPAEAAYFNARLLLGDIPVLRELYSDVARFSPVDDPDGIAVNIMSVLQSECNYDNRVLFLKYNWQSCAREILTKFEEMVR